MNACTFVFCSYYLEVLHQNYGGPASLNVAVFQGESSFTEDQTDDAVNEIQVLVADYEVFNEEQVRSGSAVAILLLCTVHLVPDCSPPLSGVDSHFWRYSLLLAFLYAKYEGTAKSQLAWLSTKPWNGEQASRLYMEVRLGPPSVPHETVFWKINVQLSMRRDKYIFCSF